MYGFDTGDEFIAVAALTVYAIWRSRGKGYKISPDTWGQVERFTKSAAKRADDVAGFMERLKPKLQCSTIQPRWCRTPDEPIDVGGRARSGGERRFLTEILAAIDHGAVLRGLYQRTAYVILLVRDRLEREKPMEIQWQAQVAEEEDVIDVIAG